MKAYIHVQTGTYICISTCKENYTIEDSWICFLPELLLQPGREKKYFRSHPHKVRKKTRSLWKILKINIKFMN